MNSIINENKTFRGRDSYAQVICLFLVIRINVKINEYETTGIKINVKDIVYSFSTYRFRIS